MASNQNINDNRAQAGLNTDNIISQIQPGYVTDALNAVNSSFDGHGVTYQNEEGSILCVTMPDGYKCIGLKNIIQLGQTWYFLTNPITGYSYIGYVAENTCTFIPVLDDSVPGSDPLDFNIDHPIHKVEVKTTNCSTELYWTDKFNHRRYIDLGNLPWKTGTTNQIDTNKMEVQPLFSIPDITPSSISIGGSLIEGVYQFAIQYADINGNGLTSFYSVTNPVSIFLESKISADYNLQTNYAISVDITNLDTTGLYQYFNLAVIKTINAVTSVDLMGTYFIMGSTYNHVYTGGEQSNANIKLTLEEVLLQNDYYDIAGDLAQVDNKIVWVDLVREEDISYQSIWSQVNVFWATSQMPTGQKIGYHNGVECAEVKGYFRDEVYALEGCFLLSNGKETTRCHIPGRLSTPADLVPVFNADSSAVEAITCPPKVLPRWKVYNTASEGVPLPGSAELCTGIKPWQYGTMSYWESEELYPANTAIWGALANQPIRHHKFPDCAVAPIYSDNGAYIYPIGFKIDVQSLYNAIQSSTYLTATQKRSIVGFKIMRSDRAADRSIVAKGMLFNMGHYNKQGTDYFYPNYPFNDVRPDQFISSVPVDDKTGPHANDWLKDFQRNRFTFHSPDTHFYQPSGIQDSLLYLETAESGQCKSHFVPVKDNAGEKLMTKKDLDLALAAGIFSTIGLNFSFSITAGITGGITTSITPTIQPQNFFPAFNTMLDIVNKLIPWYNYGWQYNGVGTYTTSTTIPTDVGEKIRFIQYGGYINSGLQGSFGDVYSINNTGRESSVFVSVSNNLPFTHEQVDINGHNLGIPVDKSRTTANSAFGANVCNSSQPFYRNISSYYGSIKRILPSQYGTIFSYNPIDTGAYGVLYDTAGNVLTDFPIVYGGDCFINRFGLKIKHPFFLKSTVNKPDGFDIDYNQDARSQTNTGNVGYPIWYYSTTNIIVPNLTDINNAVDLFMSNFTAPGIIANLVSGSFWGMITITNLMFVLIKDALLTSIGIKITNLECANYDDFYEKGMAYLYAYGIPYYFCESEVNVDMRQAYNIKEGNFYPNVATDIPDDWLQETNVPIAFDNTYTYNKTYSKQNHETAFTTLRPDWQPNQTCYITYNNRAVWSQMSDMEQTRNNWLVYKPADFYDFPKSFGTLVAMDRLETRAVLIRYTNHSQLYNVQATIETTAINASLGTGALFSGTQAIDLNITNSGYAGSQNKMLLSTEHGHIFVDAIRGQVIVLKGTAVEELSGPKYLNSKWFQNNLPFNIIKVFPTVPTDNNFNGIGLHGVYDDFYKRLIITKIDYLPTEGVKYDGTNFYIEETITGVGPTGEVTCCPEGYQYYPLVNECKFLENLEITVPPIPCVSEMNVTNKKVVFLDNKEYFCNKSWTMSFSFLSNSWISWHSYLPNFYNESPDYFQAGKNSTICTVWDHNNTYNLFNNFFGTDYPYIIEYPFSYKYLDQLLQYVEEYVTILKYEDFDNYYEPDETLYFTQSVVYNKQASTGLMNLVPKDINNMSQYISYPKYNTNSIDILVSKVDHLMSYNMIWNNLKVPNSTQWTNTCSPETGGKELNSSNFEYTNSSFKKYPLRAKDTKVRHILNKENTDFKILSKFVITKTQNMIG
jgi:hypothetical protein